MQQKIIITSDGSHSIYIPELNEHYHSIHGAIQESKHVFIEAGLKPFLRPAFLNENSGETVREINVLEVGFGTGLNALLTFVETFNYNLKINYTTIEAFPLSKEIVESLNYVSEISKLFNFDAINLKNAFNLIHNSEWEQKNSVTENFILKKIGNTLQDANLFNEKFDLIYFDAFGPPVQPEMWTEEIFAKIADATNQGGILVTYCAKGEVKRTLKKSGFIVESLPGPPGKREMVRARKS
jgi:tRNA U34 5-methylaminomethyl-2-thiouridine-forming methyltransferase MnmC